MEGLQEARFKRLPKWAQNRIRQLEANLEHYREAVMEMEAGDTNVFQRDYSGFPENDRRPMKRDSFIIFVAESGAQFEVGMREDDGLQVSTGSRSTYDRLVVRPISTNLISIEGLER